jgi:hypothetical protein
LPSLTTQSAADALDAVLEGAGASLVRDSVDARVVQQVFSFGTLGAHLDSQSQVGGWPTLESGVALLDTDQDGMSDAYEEVFGLNKLDSSDRNVIAPNGYTALENYLNFLVTGQPIPNLAGDYNGDHVVNAADYTVWRNLLGSNTPLTNETASLGVVDEDDYAAWKSNFGMTDSGAGAAGVVPEPTTWSLGMAAGLIVITFRRRCTAAANGSI